ncbi:hypothetical protein PVAP13_1NG327838 [Panicum virgatum]|uniref:Uncharacterized protein n=1 Tax=Panicum virgatum TaxID=38727 RepID=A0A8T0X967_PANVG|nr:hypothetical protein PVAP13_1NG327838 [Panicum virgatum]
MLGTVALPPPDSMLAPPLSPTVPAESRTASPFLFLLSFLHLTSNLSLSQLVRLYRYGE